MPKNWWANITEEEREAIREQKRKLYWNVRRQVPNNKKYGMKQTLCWDCRKDGRECPWMRDFEPVPGWEAEETLIMATYLPTKSFHVKQCPLFEPNEKEEKDESGTVSLSVSRSEG